MKNKYLLAVFLFFILLTYFSASIPFFWDSVYFSREAGYFYFHQPFPSLTLPAELDNGGFPFYALLMCTSWKILGYSLFSSHLIMLPLLLGIAWNYFHLCKRFLSEQMLPWALLLLCIEPCFITQSVLMAYDILLTCFFLASVHALLSGRKVMLALSLIFLASIGVRGIIAAASVGVICLLLPGHALKERMKNLTCFFPTVLLIVLWGIYHYSQTKWFFFSPYREHTDERLLSFPAMCKQCVLLVWKLVDSGRIFLWLIFFGGTWFLLRQKKLTPAFKSLLTLLFIPLICFFAVMVPLSNPGSSRYFIPVYLLLIMAVCYLIQDSSVLIRNAAFILLVIGLISGNCWIYPERFSNGWDTSLKVLPYFKLERKMGEFIQYHQIPAKEVGTQFPLIESYADRYLVTGDNKPMYTNALDGPVSKFHYYLHSNVCNTDLLPQIEVIKPKWKLITELREGQVYMSLYENPDWH